MTAAKAEAESVTNATPVENKSLEIKPAAVPVQSSDAPETQVKSKKHKPSRSTATSDTAPAPQSGDDWMAKHEAILKLTQERRGYDVLFLGDSITANMNLKLMRELISPRAMNFGISGDRTYNLLWRIQNGELKFKRNIPEIVVLLIGTNDMYEWGGLRAQTNPETYRGIKADVEAIRTALPMTKVLLVGVLPREQSPKDKIRERIKSLNKDLERLADNKHIYFADIGKDMVEKDGSISPEVMPDFLHPSADVGYDRMFKALKTHLDAIPSDG